MATGTAVDWRRYTELRADWRAFTLVALFVFVIGGALLARPLLIASGTESVVAGTSTTEQAGGGFVWALAEAIFAGLLLAVLVLYRRTPGWLQTVVRRTIRVTFWIVVALLVTAVADVLDTVVAVALLFGAIEAAKEWDLYYLINDGLALTIAVVLGAYVGVKLGPVVVAVGLIGLSVYDYYFADRKQWMFSLAEWLVRWKLPVLVVIPTALRFDWNSLLDAADDDVEPEDIGFGFGIGMADLLLPAALAVAVAGSGGLPVAGVVAGTLAACFRLSQKIHDSGGAGLPSLTVGALGGWAVATVIAVSVLGGA